MVKLEPVAMEGPREDCAIGSSELVGGSFYTLDKNKGLPISVPIWLTRRFQSCCDTGGQGLLSSGVTR